MTDIPTASLGDASTEEAPKPPKARPKKKHRHKAHIEHKLPGRIRMKVPSAKHNPALLNGYKAAFTSIPGVSRVEIREETGSILIHYDPALEAVFHGHLSDHLDRHETAVESSRPGDEIGDMARKIESEAEFLAEHSEVARVAVNFFRTLDRELKSVTDNTVDLKIVLAGGLTAFTFLEIGAEAATPMWVTLALFSVNHFIELRSPATVASAAVKGKVSAA